MPTGAFAGGLVDFLLPTGCMSCRRWIPAGEMVDGAPALVCFRCRSRLRRGSWPRCRRCHAPKGTGRDRAGSLTGEECLECRGWPAPLTAARYACTLAPPATDLVHALKYEGWRELADFMGRLMASTAIATEPETLVASHDERRSGAGAPVMMSWRDFRAISVVVPVPTTPARLRTRGYNQAALLADIVATRLGRPACREALTRTHAGASQTALSPERRRENVRGVFRGGEGAWRVEGRGVLLVDDVLTTGATALEAAATLRGQGAGEVRLLTFGRALPGRDAGEEAA